MLTSLGHTLFRTRNVVFPLLLIIVCALLPPVSIGVPGEGWVVLAGLIVLALGQGLQGLRILLQNLVEVGDAGLPVWIGHKESFVETVAFRRRRKRNRTAGAPSA